jgi:FkbM family methyltransferase
MQPPRVIKFVLILFAGAAALFLLAVKSPARLLALSAIGHSGCSLDGTLHSFDNAKLQFNLRNHFQQTTHLVRRDSTGFELWDTDHGQIWTTKGDKILPFLLAEQEMKIYGTGVRGVQPGDIVLDCGANIGMFTKTALASGARLVVAVEPAPDTLECLRRNLAKEIAQGRVIVYPKGVWDHDDFLNLAVDEHNAGSNSLVLDLNRAKSVRVPLTTIDKLVAELKLERLDFIKMDIEGAEKNALKGARSTLNRFRPHMSISAEHLSDDVEKIPLVVRDIQPTYKLEYADCQDQGSRVAPLVLQFF